MKKITSVTIVFLGFMLLLMTSTFTVRAVDTTSKKLAKNSSVVGTTKKETTFLVSSKSELKNSKIMLLSNSKLYADSEHSDPPEEEVIKDSTATITSFGDALVHSQVFKSAYNDETGKYDFSPIFKNVKKYLKKSTVTIGNQESPMAGSKRGYSGYPSFNAPEHLAIDFKEAGVDILTTANNHCLDKGYSGLSATLKNLDKAGIKHVGTSRTKKEQNKILFKNLNGIKTAFLAFTYGTNGIPMPSGKGYCVNLINKNLIKKQIKKAKRKGAEAIVVSMHWGIEYETVQNYEQEDLAKFLISNGVNVVLGCHPHVLQPMKMLKVKTKSGTKKGLVIFSQGNFFSSQTKINTRNTAIFKIKLRKNGKTGKVIVEKANYIPLFVYNKGTSKNRYEILDLNKIIKSYKKGSKKYSKELYNLAVAEKKRCCKTIGKPITSK